MIEVIAADRCTGCDICVKACPANVFDAVPGGQPVIARQNDCQTCFLCEIYCPADALFVVPRAEGPIGIDRALPMAREKFGSYARELGWTRGKAGGTQQDPTFQIRVFL